MRILIAEDDDNSRVLLECLLASEGHTVQSVTNGMAGIQALFQTLPDLIISDILMPELDGFAFLRFVRNTQPLSRIPFVMYSATYVEPQDAALAQSLGANHFIVKPFEIQELVDVINSISEVPVATARPETTHRLSPMTPAASLDAQHLDRVHSKLSKKVKELEGERTALKASERRFRDFAESAGDFFWETDADMSVRFATAQGRQMLGLPLTRVLESKHAGAGSSATDTTAMSALALQQRFQQHIIEWHDQDNGSLRLYKLCGKPYRDALGKFAGYRGVASDVTRSITLERELAYLANHDPLTGLLNRFMFERRLEAALRDAKERNATHAICYIDLDHFKVLNDTAGHIAGDDCLKHIARVIKKAVRNHDTVARFGGDEFGLLLEDCPPDKAQAIAWKVADAIAAFRYTSAGRIFEIGASIGVVDLTAASESSISLLTEADVACYAAKESGRRRVHVYQGETTRHKHLELYRAAEIADLLRSDRFCLYAQPIRAIAAKDQRQHFEVLLRHINGVGDIVGPGICISAAERYGTITAIDRWVIAQAFSKITKRNDRDDCVFTLNLSGHSVSDPFMSDYIREHFNATGLSSRSICFELTETAAFTNPDQANRFVAHMADMGCALALDDFGTGVSSLTHLKHLQVSYLKIDGSFVRDMADDPIDAAMVATIHQLGKMMKIATIAESVETEAVLDRLRDLSMDYGQGYALGRPTPMDVN